jgi:hypothetical protein
VSWTRSSSPHCRLQPSSSPSSGNNRALRRHHRVPLDELIIDVASPPSRTRQKHRRRPHLAATSPEIAGNPNLTVSSPSSLCEPSDLDRSARTNHLFERVLDDLIRPDHF